MIGDPGVGARVGMPLTGYVALNLPGMLLCFANWLLGGEPVLVAGGELVAVVEASFEA